MNNLNNPTLQTAALWVIILGTALALLLPFIASMSMRLFKRSTPTKQRIIWALGEASLAVFIGTQIAYGFSAYIFCAGTVSPYLWETNMHTAGLDDPMTMRAFFHWMTPVVCAWILFHYGGLFAIRDLHKIIKEQGDIIYARRIKSKHQ